MRRGSRKVESDEAPGAPEWMVTFSDCMTLLLTFFVLLLSFSSFDDKVFRKLKMAFFEALPGAGKQDEVNKDAFLPTRQIEETPDLTEGSEKPTLTMGLGDNLQEDTEPADFRRRNVFLVSSKRIFWGKGTLISSEGRSVLTKIALFLKEVPSRIVVSESGPPGAEDAGQLGLLRAWALVDYLTTEENLDKRCFSISAASTLARANLGSNEPAGTNQEPERIVEVVLLERSIYN